ncbi:hypothetical protein ACFYRC_07305 [Streptomyces sp. NPDC005279]|uniref:hypothetical protein n=1 Tax=Streptomyces sp. NPDC005279 TaxID=3364712 RepID=UPI00367ED499
MFVTEFGTQTASGDGGNSFTRAQQYIDPMARKKISWSNWNYSDGERSGAVRPLEAAGVRVRDRTRTPDDFPTG